MCILFMRHRLAGGRGVLALARSGLCASRSAMRWRGSCAGTAAATARVLSVTSPFASEVDHTVYVVAADNYSSATAAVTVDVISSISFGVVDSAVSVLVDQASVIYTAEASCGLSDDYVYSELVATNNFEVNSNGQVNLTPAITSPGLHTHRRFGARRG